MDAMQQELKAFKDPALARGLIESIQALAPESATLMEVCGTHTVAIARNGIRGLMPEGVRLASGPGCPVCVTSNHDIDQVIAAGCPAPGAGEPHAADRLRRCGLRNHHAAGGYGHQAGARHGAHKLHRVRRPQEHARGAGSHYQ